MSTGNYIIHSYYCRISYGNFNLIDNSKHSVVRNGNFNQITSSVYSGVSNGDHNDIHQSENCHIAGSGNTINSKDRRIIGNHNVIIG